MRHHSGEGDKSKKQHEIGRNAAPDLSEAEFAIDDEIDPADFFDPEEFGFRRGNSHASR